MSLEITLKGKNVLVTGGGNGIGRALCERLHAQGAQVYALCKVKEWLDTLSVEKPGIKTICVDLEDWDATRKAVTDLGVTMDCLVNNAGIGAVESFMQVTKENFDKQMAVNVKAIINVSQVVAKGMIERGSGGAIVNISSLGARYPIKISTVYSLTKASVDMLTKSMAVELGPHNIRVNAVNPTIVHTDMGKDFGGKTADGGTSVYDKIIGRTPLGKLASKEEIVEVILVLLSDRNTMINGENIFVDGGFSCS